MLSQQRRSQIELICYATVGGMMASMCNPKYRGSNFTWEKFPEMMEGFCEVHVLGADILSFKTHDEGIEYAKSFSKQLAERWVRTMTE